MRSWASRRVQVHRRTIVGALAVLVVATAGVGGYLIGHSSDTDLEQARLTAAAEGRMKGSGKGLDEGYAQGYRSARRTGYAAAYSRAFEKAYAAEFQSAGLDVPAKIPVSERR